MNGMFLILATFLAATIEGVEMVAILVGMGATRGLRSRFFSSRRIDLCAGQGIIKTPLATCRQDNDSLVELALKRCLHFTLPLVSRLHIT
jgi:hypothetical protein